MKAAVGMFIFVTTVDYERTSPKPVNQTGFRLISGALIAFGMLVVLVAVCGVVGARRRDEKAQKAKEQSQPQPDTPAPSLDTTPPIAS